ncbi:MAG: hypothetical protein O7G88_14990 [bacterium]|nr:hypothetical protein [bacterium]
MRFTIDAPICQTAPQPQEAANATAWECAQAASSCTLKWAFNGIELMLTLRDATDNALFSRIKKVLPKIEERKELQRQQRQERDHPDILQRCLDGEFSSVTQAAIAAGILRKKVQHSGK